MTQHALKKSSFTLPSKEVPLVKQLKKRLNLSSNTEVIRLALYELRSKLDRSAIRKQFQRASEIVKDTNKKDMEYLDALASEGI
jgi:hypothetical protein